MTSNIGGPITRSEVIDRAKNWYQKRANIVYSQGNVTYPDSTGKGYRPDCSGYVSMAWHLSDSLNTVGLPTVAKQITKSELQAGDVLNVPLPGNAGHVVIFEKWSSSAQTSFYGYEFSPPIQYHEITITQATNNTCKLGQDSRNYTPLRYNNIVDDIAIATPTQGITEEEKPMILQQTTGSRLAFVIMPGGKAQPIGSDDLKALKAAGVGHAVITDSLWSKFRVAYGVTFT